MRPKKTPSLLQMEASECGAAALGIILAYYGYFVALEELRDRCGISRDGSKASNIIRAAKHYGLTAEGLSASMKEAQLLTQPFIAFWKFNHFIVIEGFKNKKVYINDPATGRRTINLEEFSHDFTGVILLLSPTDQFKKMGRPHTVRRSLSQYLTFSHSALVFCALTSLFLIIPGIAIPGFTKVFIDSILLEGMNSWFMPLILGLLMVGILQSILVYLQRTCLLYLRIKMNLLMSTEFVWWVLHLPMKFFYQRFTGDIVDRIKSNDRISDLLSSQVSGSIINVCSMFFFALILFLISWPLAWIGVAFALINVTVLFAVSQKISDISHQFLQQQGKLRGFEMTLINSIEIIKANAMEDHFFKRWSGLYASYTNNLQRIEYYGRVLNIIPSALNGLLAVITLGLGSYLIILGLLSVGTLVAFQALLINFNRPLLALLNAGVRLQNIYGDLYRVNDVFNYPATTQQPPKELANIKDLSFDIKIDTLNFGYSSLEKPLIREINLTIQEQKKIAIVGRTGSGKSTLAKLICRLYQPWEGTISIGGYTLDQFTQTDLSTILAYVDQDIFLFEGNIRDNLTLWDKNISTKELDRAIQLSGANEFLNSRGGLYAEVKERGTNYSGGQRQLIEISRALVNNPKIIILDEATANLDQALEHRVIQNLTHLDTTLILITHRLNAIKHFDCILVMGDGEIVEQGTHQELMQLKGVYFQLYQ